MCVMVCAVNWNRAKNLLLIHHPPQDNACCVCVCVSSSLKNSLLCICVVSTQQTGVRREIQYGIWEKPHPPKKHFKKYPSSLSVSPSSPSFSELTDKPLHISHLSLLPHLSPRHAKIISPNHRQLSLITLVYYANLSTGISSGRIRQTSANRCQWRLQRWTSGGANLTNALQMENVKESI